MASDPPVFVLGVERSGSTWLASIFDASAEVGLLMEPLAPYALFAPAFPVRTLRLGGDDRALVTHVRAGIAQARALRGAAPGARERWLGRFGRAPGYRVEIQLAERLGLSASLRARRRALLHLHGGEGALGPRLVVKELRLNLAVPLLHAAWPSARVVVALRNPVPQVASIVRQFDRGGLREVQAALTGLQAWAAADPASRDRLGAVPAPDDVVARATWYWAWQYDALLRDLADASIASHVVAHEDLSRDATAGARAVFRFSGLSFCAGVEAHVIRSSTTARASDSPVDTQRVSADYVEQARAHVSDEVEATVMRTLEPLWDGLSAPLRRYAR